MDEDRYPSVDPGDRKRITRGTRPWQAERPFRVMLHFYYLVSFLCLLRGEEALRIQWDWLNFDINNPEIPGGTRLELTLPFRKTHQSGGT